MHTATAHRPLVYTGVAVLAVVLLAVNWNLLTALSVWHLPGPFMLPIFGNALSLTSAPWLQFAAWHDVYGKIYRLCVSGGARSRLWTHRRHSLHAASACARSGVFNLNFVAVCDPDAIKAILRTETGKFAKDQWTYDTFRCVCGGDGRGRNFRRPLRGSDAPLPPPAGRCWGEAW